MRRSVIFRAKDLSVIAQKRRDAENDCLIALCGARGSSKSTLGYKIMLRLKGKPERDLVYDRDRLLKALKEWYRVIDADEMINSAYKREFYNVDQIDLIKILNMYRDHGHVLILCIPNFWDLDKPIRDMVKIRIDMVKRGVGVVHFPLPLMYSNDPWDSKVNQKIERKWVRTGGRFKPKYWKLTTFKGYVVFGKLSPQQEKKYKKIKNLRREEIAKKQDQLNNKNKEQEVGNLNIDNIITLLKEKPLSRETISQLAFMNNMTYQTLRSSVNKRLRETGQMTTFKDLTLSEKQYQKKKEKEIEDSKPRFQLPEIEDDYFDDSYSD